MGKWDQYEDKAASPGSKWGQYEVKATPAPAPAEEPGWFQPGSKSEALVRGFSQGATLGFGDEIQALIRSLGSDQTYSQLRDEERAANAQAASTNTGSYLAGNLIGSAPSALNVTSLGSKAALRSAAKSGMSPLTAQVTSSLPKSGLLRTAKVGGATGAAAGLGSAEGDMGDQALSTALGGTIGAVVPTATMAALRPVRNAAAIVGGTRQTSTNLLPAAASIEAQRKRDAAAGAIAGGVGTALSGGSFVEGAAAGGLAGYSGAVPVTKLAGITARVTRAAVDRGGRAGAAGTLALTEALRNMSGQTSRQVVTAADQQIQQAVQAGQPAYAATFSALQQPVVRTAQQKLQESGEQPEEDEEDDSED